MAPVITLTTDFGTRDPYVAAMKGVLLARCPETSIVDLSHEIAAHDVIEGACFLASALPYFPGGAIHIAVVDPGVGTTRRPLAVRLAGQVVLAPDNGLITLVSREHPPDEVREITRVDPPGERVSPTFHGRDLFAPAAAMLARGLPFRDLGPPVRSPVALELPEPSAEGDRVRGVVIHVDRFGTAITNLRRYHLGDATATREVRMGRRSLGPIRRTYGEVAAGEPLALIGSAGYLEVAVNQGRADATLGLGRGDVIEVVLDAG